MADEPDPVEDELDEDVPRYLDGEFADADDGGSGIDILDEEEYVPEDVPELINPAAMTKLRRFMEARDLRDDLEAQLAAAKKAYTEIEGEVHLMIAMSPMARLGNIDLGTPWGITSFGAMETTYARVLDEDAAKEHFEKEGASSYIKQDKLVMARMNEEVRRAEEEGTTPPPGLDSYKKRYVQITRQKD
jgi:hypothetical protein